MIINTDGPLAFALTLKRWFALNGWPQKITDDWANDPGVLYPHGPWASQMCGAMKADGYNPRAEFFLALAEFNRFIDKQDTKAISNRKLRDRLTGSTPLMSDEGALYSAPDFWSLFAGVVEPPAQYMADTQVLTQEGVDRAVALMRDNFRQVSLQYMVSPATAWEMLQAAIVEAGNEAGVYVSPDDIQVFREVLAGLYDHTPETLSAVAQRYGKNDPVVKAFHNLLKDDAKKQKPTASYKRVSAQN